MAKAAAVGTLILTFGFMLHPAAAANKMSGAALDEVLAWLSTKPAVVPGDAARNEMMKKLDAPFLEDTAVLNSAVGKYFKARMKAFTADIAATAAPAGGHVIVWKLYNMGAVMKSGEATIAFDLISGRDKVKWTSEDLKKTIGACDALVITHSHLDHADMAVAKKFLAAGKTVVTPPGIWEKLPGMGGITLLRDGTIDIKGVKLTAFPGFQSETMNNVYLIEFPGGVKVLDTGDENGKAYPTGGGWLAGVRPPRNVDLLMFNSWSAIMKEMLAAFPAKMLMPAHEHELTHGPQSRSSYEEMISTSESLGVPYVLMAWGERFEVSPDRD